MYGRTGKHHRRRFIRRSVTGPGYSNDELSRVGGRALLVNGRCYFSGTSEIWTRF